WVAGLDATDLLKYQAIGTCASDKQGEVLARLAKERMAMVRDSLDGPIQHGRDLKHREESDEFKVARLLLKASRVDRNGAVVDMRAEAKVEPDDLATFFQILTP